MPTPTTREPDPGLGFDRIRKDRYLDAAYQAREWDKIWTKVWLYAVPAQDVAEPGSWATFHIGTEPILITRDADGVLRAHSNVCQHRGRRLVDGDRGTAAFFTCGYHAWTYELDGRMRSIHEPDQYAGRLPCDVDLPEIRVDEWGGLVWVCLDPDAEPLLDYLSPLPEHLACYPLHRWAIECDESVVWDCNWKVGVDAFHETYHNLGTHPQLMGYAGDTNVPIDTYDRHSRFIISNGAPAPSWRKRDTITPAQAAFFEANGFDHASFTGDADDARLAYQEFKRDKMLAEGFDVSGFELRQFTDNFHYTIFPNTQISFRADNSLVNRGRPMPGNWNRMIFDAQTFTHVPEGQPFPPRPETVRGEGADFPFTLHFIRQDSVMMPRIYEGIQAASYRGALLSDLELRIRHWHSVYDRHLGI